MWNVPGIVSFDPLDSSVRLDTCYFLHFTSELIAIYQRFSSSLVEDMGWKLNSWLQFESWDQSPSIIHLYDVLNKIATKVKAADC